MVNMLMDHVILLQFVGSVNEQFELVGMRSHVLMFENPPSFILDVICVRTIGTIWGATNRFI
jgi:hypothetical protein